MQRLEGLMRKAIQEYKMIEPGDRICVGVSGGKDSVALTVGLAHLRRYLNIPFEVVAVSLDPQFGGKATDYAPLEKLFAKLEVPFEIRRSNIGAVVFDVRKEPNPCALCAKMRRGLLHDTAKELGCNKVALGHHLDDAIETFYMNLWGEGRLGCFSPVTYLSRKDLTMIRPMILATESDVRRAVNHESLPVVKSACPADGATRRQEMKEYVADMCRKDRAFRQKMLGAMQGADLDGWAPVAKG
ncbi:tRNA 2-thiocytidine biosynthesis TtcA family protein [Fournierella massiliensis]|uniref:tRNA 2-thiocytidine biosynthesis TtcA family protein n=1 Tax=Allofournierella massiliensis TaxID=1650663 RepID=UPI003521E0B1